MPLNHTIIIIKYCGPIHWVRANSLIKMRANSPCGPIHCGPIHLRAKSLESVTIWKVGNHGNPTLVAIQYTHRHTHYIDSKFLYNIHTNNWPQCFNFTYFMDFLLKIDHFLLTGCYGKMQKIVRFKFFHFNFRKSFNPKLHLHITKMTCPCAGFQSKSIFKRCYKH